MNNSDYRMTRVTFGVSASSFTAKAVSESLYVDDCLSRANSIEETIKLRQQLQDLFSRADFLLRKWRSSELAVLEHIPPDLKDPQLMQPIPNPGEYTGNRVERCCGPLLPNDC